MPAGHRSFAPRCVILRGRGTATLAAGRDRADNPAAHCGDGRWLEGSGRFKAMLIDDKAVLTDQDRKYVYVLGEKNAATRKDVVLGPVVDGLRVVNSGLAPQDKVIVHGVQKVFFPGMPVAPKQIAMGAPAPSPQVAMK